MGGTWVHRGLDVPGCILTYVLIVVLEFTQAWELGSAPGLCSLSTPSGNGPSGSLTGLMFTLYLAVF